MPAVYKLNSKQLKAAATLTREESILKLKLANVQKSLARLSPVMTEAQELATKMHAEKCTQNHDTDCMWNYRHNPDGWTEDTTHKHYLNTATDLLKK